MTLEQISEAYAALKAILRLTGQDSEWSCGRWDSELHRAIENARELVEQIELADKGLV